MKKPINMDVFYDEEKETIGISWIYTITRHTHKTQISSNTTQFVINLNSTIQELAKVRKVIFIYENEGKFHMATSEPLDDRDYETILTRGNRTQTTVQLPAQFLKLKKDTPQSAKITIYPQLEDPLSGNKPMTLFEVIDREDDEDDPHVYMKDGILYLRWRINPNEKLPKQMKEFLPEDIIEELEKILVPRDVIINTRTLDYEVQSTINREEEWNAD